MAEGKQEHPRLVLQNFLSLHQCKELEFIHKSNSTVGYRSNVFSTTLSHLVSTNCPHLLMPFVPIRERLKAKVEEFFGCDYELVVEFTGLISSLEFLPSMHLRDCISDNIMRNKSAGVVEQALDGTVMITGPILNSVPLRYGKDFKGGLFHFQDGEPPTIEPLAGDVVIYTADSRNIHCVDEITGGERLTLTLWFSRDTSHDEDSKLVSLLSQSLLENDVPGAHLPLPASCNMYWFSQDHTSHDRLGFDICWARLHILGFDVYSQYSSDSNFSELLMKPLQLARGNELLEQEFVNILHALQVVQFYFWKASFSETSKVSGDSGKVVELAQLQRERINCLRSVLLKDHQLAEMIFRGMTSNESGWLCFDWADFASAVALWEDYASKLREELIRSLPFWRTYQSIFEVPSDGF